MTHMRHARVVIRSRLIHDSYDVYETCRIDTSRVDSIHVMIRKDRCNDCNNHEY
jgi:hypothetical protein